MQSIIAREDGTPLPPAIDSVFTHGARSGVDNNARAQFLFSIFRQPKRAAVYPVHMNADHDNDND